MTTLYDGDNLDIVRRNVADAIAAIIAAKSARDAT